MKHRINMKFLELLLISSVIFLYTLYAVYGLKKVQLPTYIIPKHYDIYLSQGTIDNDFFDGTCRVWIMPIELDYPLHNIYLHAQEPQINIHSFLLIAVWNSTNYVPNNYTYDNESHIINLSFTNKLLTYMSYVLEMKFTTSLNGKGLIKSYYTNKEGWNM